MATAVAAAWEIWQQNRTKSSLGSRNLVRWYVDVEFSIGWWNIFFLRLFKWISFSAVYTLFLLFFYWINFSYENRNAKNGVDRRRRKKLKGFIDIDIIAGSTAIDNFPILLICTIQKYPRKKNTHTKKVRREKRNKIETSKRRQQRQTLMYLIIHISTLNRCELEVGFSLFLSLPL